jgi:molybdopterin synthase sulfur carrier subunit
MLVRHLDVQPDFSVDAKDLGGLLDVVDKEVEGFHDSICDETGRIRMYVNVFLNGDNISQDPQALSVPLHDGDEIYILANVAGGSR